MRRRDAVDRRLIAFLKENAAYRRYVLRELERRGPLLSREIEDHAPTEREAHRWWGERKMGLMLGVLNARGEVAVVGRRGKQRVWDLAERWYPETETMHVGRGEAALRGEAVPLARRAAREGQVVAHPDADDGPVPRARTTFLSPFDQLVHDRNRAHALWDFFYRLEMYVPKAKREYGYYVLPILRGDRVVGRIEPVHDRKAGTLRVLGTWWEDKPVGARPAAAEPRALAGRESLTCAAWTSRRARSTPARSPTRRPARSSRRSTRPPRTCRRRSACTRATTTRASATRRAPRCRSRSRASRTRSTASRSARGSARRRR